mmetsp:Transcript_41427/g.58303  ORF Transcript_41427/g.58303 Transcript_41427/m.58303 type:complete len:83 (+) Transcript_41427:643-891(+)
MRLQWSSSVSFLKTANAVLNLISRGAKHQASKGEQERLYSAAMQHGTQYWKKQKEKKGTFQHLLRSHYLKRVDKKQYVYWEK